jgi:uncharacterized protein
VIEPVDVRDLVGHPGASRTVIVRGTVEGLDTELATLADDGLVRAELLLESIVEGVFVSGTIGATMRVRCSRCLEESDRPLVATVNELFCADPDEESEAYEMDADGWLPPEQMVRDAVGVELPFAPLCRPDCLGLCSVCGENRNLGACPGHEEIDPRWAELERLLEPSAD